MVSGLGAVVGSVSSAPIVARFCEPHPHYLLSGFMIVTFTMRVIQFTTSSYPLFLLSMFVFAFMGVGVVNPIRGSLPSQFVLESEIGGCLGLKAAIESISGIVGPALAAGIGISFAL